MLTGKAAKIAAMQRLLTEGLSSGVSDQPMNDIRAEVRAEIQAGKSGAEPGKIESFGAP